MSITPNPDFTAELVERTVLVHWPDNDRQGATPPPDGWQEHAWASQPTLHEIDEGSVSGCSVLRWRDDPRPDRELLAVSLALVTGGPDPSAVSVVPPATNQTADVVEACRKFPLPARAALITYAATTRTVTADALTPLLDAVDAECRASALRDFLWRLEQSAGDAAAEKLLDDNPELRRMAAEAPHAEAPDEAPDEAPPREPHPTEADLRHALAVLARFHGRDTAAPAVVAQPGKENDTGARIVAHVLATHTDLHCLNCTPPPHGDVWTPVTADELDDGGVCVQCGVDVLIPQEESRG